VRIFRSENSKSLYERLGGPDVMKDAVKRLYFKILTDPVLSPFFSYDKLEMIKRHQIAFMTMAFGGPNEYEGRDLRNAHAPLLEQGLTDKHFDALLGHLAETLKDQGQPHDLISEVIEIVEGLRKEVLVR